MFTFQVFLNSRQVFETETEASYTTNRNNEDVCVVAQDKQGNNLRECDIVEEPFEVAWASSGVLRPGTSYCAIKHILCKLLISILYKQICVYLLLFSSSRMKEQYSAEEL